MAKITTASLGSAASSMKKTGLPAALGFGDDADLDDQDGLGQASASAEDRKCERHDFFVLINQLIVS